MRQLSSARISCIATRSVILDESKISPLGSAEVNLAGGQSTLAELPVIALVLFQLFTSEMHTSTFAFPRLADCSLGQSCEKE